MNNRQLMALSGCRFSQELGRVDSTGAYDCFEIGGICVSQRMRCVRRCIVALAAGGDKYRNLLDQITVLCH